MKTTIISVVALLSLLIAPVVLAQSYYGTCVSIPAGLGIGARSSDVTNLQNFLVSQNYPGGGSWMVTGYFGAATQAALRDFQQQHGLPQSGMTDAATAAAISGNCAGVPYTPAVVPSYVAPSYVAPTYYPNTNLPYNTNYNSNYNTYPSNYYGNTPAITSLSQNTGAPGSTVTIFGIGFDPYNNTVNVGGTAVYNVPSSNGTSLTVTIPATTYYTYSIAGTPLQLTVSNSRGTSNAVAFTVWGTPYTPCGGYSYGSVPGQQGNNNCGGCTNYQYGYPYNSNMYCPPQNTTTPIINYLSPVSGGPSTSVTVYGSGFTPNNNVVHFGPGIIANLSSYDGHSVSFLVPSQINGYGTQPLTLSTYQVSVTNSYGIASNAVPFAVTSLLNGNGAPSIASVNGPTSLAVGQQGTWTILVNTANNSYLTVSVNWGDALGYGVAPATQQVYSGQQNNTFTHTYNTSGTYTVQFAISNAAGQQNLYTTTVVVGTGNVTQTNSVSIYNMAFNPQTVYVHAGQTVVWTNNDTMAHTVTSDSNYFNSGTLNPGQTFSYTFNSQGTYTYHCSIHPNMTGTVIVTP